MVTCSPAELDLSALADLARNPFRVIGLPGNASQSDIYKAINARRAESKLRLSRLTPWDFPLLGPVIRDEGTIQEAVGQLTDPVSRCRARLFWFSGEESVEQVSAESAEILAEKWSADHHPLGRHDAALLYWLLALAHPSSKTQSNYWAKALRQWSEAIGSPDFWPTISAAEINGQFDRVDSDAIEAVRAAAPGAVAEAIAGAANDALVAGEIEKCSRLLKHLTDGWAPDEVDRRLYDEVLGPLEDRIIAQCDEIERSCEAKLVRKDECAAQNRAACATATESFDKIIVEALDELARAGAEPSRLSRVSERAATLLMRLAQSWTWADNFIECEAMLLRAKQIAAGTPVEVRIDEQLVKVERAASQQRLLRGASASAAEHNISQNESRAAWHITVPSNEIRVPPFCTCCLVPTSRTRRVKHERQIAGNRRRTVWYSLPLCEDCARHEREFELKRLLVSLGPAILTVASMWMIWASSPNCGSAWFFAIGVGVACSILAIFARIPIRQLSGNHSCRSQSATLASASDTNCTFRFLNQRYAGAFAVANNVTASPTKAPHFGPTGRIFSACGRGAVVASFVLALAAVPLCYCWQPFAENTPAAASALNGNSSTPSTSATNTQVLSSNRHDARLESLKQEIDFGKTRASEMETELNALQSERDELKGKMSDLKTTIHQDESDDRNGIQINVDAYNHAVDDYNALVPQWNQLLADYDNKNDAYSAEIKQINERVAEYNALIGAQP